MTKILTKLNKIQVELKAPKGQYNSFGKFRYRSCEDILEAVKPLLEKHKCVLIISDTIEQIGERFYVRADATIYDSESGECINNTALAREDEAKSGMASAQLSGATSSYARKYALNGLLCIDDAKDPDTDVNTAKRQGKPLPKYTCAECGKEIVSVTKRDGEPWEVSDMVDYGMKMFGRTLCADCMKAERKKNA